MAISIGGININDWELVETFIRASGPGGQNVNKVASAVQLRFDARNSPSLPDAVKARLRSVAGRRMTAAGEIIIEASRFRSQERNREDARARLADGPDDGGRHSGTTVVAATHDCALIAAAATPPKKRIKTKVSVNQKRKRVEDKRRRSVVKTRRSSSIVAD